MNIYQSEFLTISKQGDALVQTWTDKNLNADEYQHELYNFMDVFNEAKPKELIWDTKKCSLILPEQLDAWMAEKILIPINKRGIRKMAFTIPENIPVYLSIVSSLEKAKPIMLSSYYADLNETSLFLDESVVQVNQEDLRGVDFTVTNEGSSLGVDLDVSFNDLPNFLNLVKQIEKDNEFVKRKQEQYYSLTIREMQIFKLIALGQANKQIAQELFIEESSVKTHRKNIKKKLSITSNFDIYQYARCFHII